MTLLRTENLTKRFGGTTVVDDLTLAVGSGEVRGVIGPNGAGKTTLFNLLTGLVAPTDGRILVDGTDLAGRPVEERVEYGLARSFQINSLYPRLTVAEHLFIGITGAMPRRLGLLPPGRSAVDKEVRDLADMMGLGDSLDLLVDLLPYGAKRVTEIAVALAAKPRILLLDEPTSGLGGAERGRLLGLMSTIREVIESVLIIEHDLDMVMAVSDAITVLDRGKVIAEGTPAEIAANRTVQRIYLEGVPA